MLIKYQSVFVIMRVEYIFNNAHQIYCQPVGKATILVVKYFQVKFNKVAIFMYASTETQHCRASIGQPTTSA